VVGDSPFSTSGAVHRTGMGVATAATDDDAADSRGSAVWCALWYIDVGDAALETAAFAAAAVAEAALRHR
jgi:hypothetical protein